MKFFILFVFVFTLSNHSAQAQIKTDQLLDSAWSYQQTDMHLSLEFGQKALKRARDEKDNLRIAKAHNEIASTYSQHGDQEEALTSFLASLRILEELKDSLRISSIRSNIGAIYIRSGNYQQAVDQFKLVLDLTQDAQDTIGIGEAMVNLAAAYFQLDNFDKSKLYYHLALRLESYATAEQSASLHNNLGVLFCETNQPDSALKHLAVARDTYDKLKNNHGLVTSESNIALAFKTAKDYGAAISHELTVVKLSKRYHFPERLSQSYFSLASIYNKMGQYKKALDYFLLQNDLNDSLAIDATSKSLLELETKYNSKKRQQENELLKKDNELNSLQISNQKTELGRQKWIIGFIFLALAAAGAFVFVLIRSMKARKAASALILDQKEQLTEKNQEITDSITYAKSIQDAMLPSEDSISHAFTDSFVFFKPRDIVSGDFYYFEEQGNRKFIAAADCTGHGVPGAFVSMLCSNQLHKHNIEFNISSPGEILSSVNRGVINQFQRDNKKTKANDGMDIAFCLFDKDKMEVQFSGANNPLVFVRNNEYQVIKADRRAVGGHTDSSFSFTTQTIAVEPGDFFYLFSDGFQDQFGGPKGKKFKSRKMYQLFEQLATLPGQEQHKKLNSTYADWKGDLEQIDDVCVLGFRV